MTSMQEAYCRAALARMCEINVDRHGKRLKVIPLHFDKNLLINSNSGGQYNPIRHHIVVVEDEGDTTEHLLLKILHDFRHYWQEQNYPGIFNWWIFESNHLYGRLRNTKLCAIEEDARVYERSRGRAGREDLLKCYDRDAFCLLRDEPYILALVLRACGLDSNLFLI